MTGTIHTLGYAHPDAQARLHALMDSDLTMVPVDIRYSPRSHWYPQWSGQALQKTWGDRYRHIKALGNVNYRSAAPIQLMDADAGVRWAVATLKAGYSLILLCACRDEERCHRKVVKELVMLALDASPS